MKKKIKQTAIEWLYNLSKQRELDIFDLEQAIEMEKEQKKLMFDCGRQYQLTGEGTFTQVYNEIYGK